MSHRARGFVFALLLPTLLTAPAVFAEPGSPFSESPERIVQDGVFRGKIFIASNATPEERDAAGYMAEWIHRVTGASPAIAPETPGRRERGIYLGDTQYARAAGVVAPVTISHEAFVWEPGKRGIFFIVGETPLATRLAVGRFISERLGVVFVMPGEFGADWSPRRTVELPESRREFIPSFAWRKFSGLDKPAERRWALDNGMGELPAMNHALWDVFDKKAFAENPAMFPVIGGKLTGPSGLGGYEPQPNLANPDSAKHAAKRAFEFFQKNPGAPAFSLSINDNMTWDDSPESKAALGAGKYFRNRPDYSDYVFGFMNRTARALRETEKRETRSERREKPEPALESRVSNLGSSGVSRLLTAYAYYHCENAPSFPVEPGVFPILTADRSEWRDPAFAAEDRDLITRWAKSGAGRFGIYDYYYGRSMAAPRVFLKAEGDSLRFAAKAGASLFFAELEPDWGFDGPKAWLAARLAADASSDPGALLDSYYEAAYGPAAPAMRRFFEIAESRWTHRDQPPRWIRFFRQESVAELFPADTVVAMRAALEEAEGAFPATKPYDVKDDAGRAARCRLRVRATSLSFAKTEAFLESYRLRRELSLAPEAKDEASFAKVLERVRACGEADRRYFIACEKWNKSDLNPGVEFAPGAFWRAWTPALVASQCGEFWKRFPADNDGLTPSLREVAVSAERPPSGVEVVMRESFEEKDFRASHPGTRGAAMGLTIPLEPWKTNLSEAEFTRFGFSKERAAEGEGSLRIGGGDFAGLVRTVAVFPGDTVGARLKYSGKIMPGETLAVSIRFLDAKGGRAGPEPGTIAFPSDDTGWRTLAIATGAPAGAASAEIRLRVMNQGASSDLWVDDFQIRTLTDGAPLE